MINEIARCLNMPFNIAAGNSSGYNYSWGRLDHHAFFKGIRIDLAYLADVVLDRILKAWIDEAVLIRDSSCFACVSSKNVLHELR